MHVIFYLASAQLKLSGGMKWRAVSLHELPQHENDSKWRVISKHYLLTPQETDALRWKCCPLTHSFYDELTHADYLWLAHERLKHGLLQNPPFPLINLYGRHMNDPLWELIGSDYQLNLFTVDALKIEYCDKSTIIAGSGNNKPFFLFSFHF